MTGVFVLVLLSAVAVTGTLTLLYRDLFVSVILLSIFSFLSALLLYVSHAPDVAITEAAVGAGMTTLMFVWAVHSCSPVEPRLLSGGPDWKKIVDLLLVLSVGICLYFLLPGMEGTPVLLRDSLLDTGQADTGAQNLVSAVYLGYRAFDTFGETIVLLCAVTGSIYFLSRSN